MNAFGIGYGFALAGSFAAWMVAFSSRGPSPVPVQALAVPLAFGSGTIFAVGWLGMRSAPLGLRSRDIRAEFRAADPCGWRSAVAGFLSGVAGIAALVGAVAAGGPGENERDVRMLQFLALGFGGMAVAPLVGVAVFLRLFGRRQVPPSPPPGGQCP